jgi:predicted TIM-barrel fold metal-dependent hydrolase
VRAARGHRKTTVIWAHMASPLSPSGLRDILRDEPNIFFDLSAKNPACCPRPAQQEYPLMSLRAIDETWRQLFEAFPDRFLLGVDFFTRRHLAAAREAGVFYRTLLAQLTPATARNIGYRNAERLYGLH